MPSVNDPFKPGEGSTRKPRSATHAESVAGAVPSRAHPEGSGPFKPQPGSRGRWDFGSGQVADRPASRPTSKSGRNSGQNERSAF